MMLSLRIIVITALDPSMTIQLLFLIIHPGICKVITTENPLVCQAGEDALFKWTTDDGRVIYSVNWGIKNGNSPDSQFMNTNIYTKVVNINKNMNPKYRGRVFFVGNLTLGRAWFLLKNVTKYDEKQYVANIREDQNGLFSYIVRLKVEEKAPVTETTQMVLTRNTSGYPTSTIATDPTSEKSHSFAATPSIAPRVPKIATTKESQINDTNGPYMTVRPSGPSSISVAVFLPLLVILAFAVAIILYKKLKPEPEQNATAAEEGLMEVNSKA